MFPVPDGEWSCGGTEGISVDSVDMAKCYHAHGFSNNDVVVAQNIGGNEV